ncbi:thioredoxin domain-containing protein [Actinoalloteichus hymeniacidonis]|uniref:Spermatogenesis-associated protein 20-like TRX domain-containing protein n=1 Tax=Actinoalloteichus hymeniacidonis TaxID=340345 RepID=A0AAC9MWT3_9PSEU|nr:thioredoxin domain-containing protein [Actinoalloteichus hymeniacidonis]AOS61650.1 hypothetical protein TL08_04100 [Actinoalloteichus hymeniacidonis]MBB5910336.1 hypothetical protein [Actinoalloteichus hymeniacidonis]
MANRLADATSPYLQQHADNPVDWYPWGPEAFAEAARRDVPVLLSIGYAACHWCHVMAHESFEDPAIAGLLNENFVNVKVDREERPDIDAVYMTATQAMTGSGGWPMTCFLTPEGEPFHCGTYYPPTPRPGMPSFPQLIDAVAQAWHERNDEVREAAGRIVAGLAEQTAPLPAAAVDESTLVSAVAALTTGFDRGNGGFGGAPKFPPSMVLEFLLRHHERTADRSALRMVEQTCAAMARGGLYDQLAGGFARYSVDAQWIVPHFEKMLYDNALLVRVYAHLARRTGSAFAERIATETVEFLLTELRTEQGGFAASLDADTDGVEGSTYVWTPAELIDVLGAEDGAWAARLLAVTEEGSFEHGSSTLRLLADPDGEPEADSAAAEPAATEAVATEATQTESAGAPGWQRWQRIRTTLRVARDRRSQPARDDKVVTAWNGLTITALAEAGTALGRADWIAAAVEAAELLLSLHFADGRLLRSSRDGTAGSARAVLEDYGSLAQGLLALHQATAAPRWLTEAETLLDATLRHFADPEVSGLFHDTADDAERLVRRPSDPGDNASPSGASAAAEALLTASALTGPERAGRYRAAAEEALARAGVLVARSPRFAGHWLTVAEGMITGPLQIAVAAGTDESGAAELLATARSLAPGGTVVVAGLGDDQGVPLLADRTSIGGAAAAYVCRGYVCDLPLTEAAELRAALTR